MAYNYRGLLLGDASSIYEEQYGFGANAVTLPGISSCTGVILKTGAALHGIHLTRSTEPERVTALIHGAVGGLAGHNITNVYFVGYMNFRTPLVPDLGTGEVFTQAREVCAMAGCAGAERQAYVIQTASTVRATMTNGGNDVRIERRDHPELPLAGWEVVAPLRI